jgi:serine/threonine-protein kinase
MKTCGACHRLFDETSGFCPVDGTKLDPVDLQKLPSDAEDSRIGKTLCGRYTLFRTVADGGMGRVYQALDQRANRSVALKILHPEVAADGVAVERFKREFEISSSLPHDHIVDVLGFETTDDASFALVMEYLEGEELRMLLKREKTIRPERLIRMLSQTALGLQGAHDRKQVHRDLKPDNIFLCHTPDGDVTKILDFGSVRDNSENAKKLTVMGTTIGSPFYMAPEQAQGLPSLDHRADVWSAAAIAYECLTGTVPFAGSTGPAILLAILTQDPPPISEAGRAVSIPETLDDVMERALSKNPDLRYSSIGELADAVGAAYGLEGDHRLWATLPEARLTALVAERLPNKLEEHKQKKAAALDVSNLDAAFRAGSQGGPAGIAGTTLPDDYVIMGMPSARPAWFWPAVGGGALVVVGLLVFLLVRL